MKERIGKPICKIFSKENIVTVLLEICPFAMSFAMASLFLIACPLPSRLFLSSSWTPTVKNLNFHQLTLTFFRKSGSSRNAQRNLFSTLRWQTCDFFSCPSMARSTLKLQLSTPRTRCRCIWIILDQNWNLWKLIFRVFFLDENLISGRIFFIFFVKSKCKQNFTNFRLSLSF